MPIFAAFLLTAAGAPETTSVRVRHVIDGDTVILDDGRHVRLIGINAPEFKPWKNEVDRYGEEAKLFSERLLEGESVRLEPDIETVDRYGRTLAYVYLKDGRLANKVLVENGMARAVYYRPNGTHRKELEAAEREAAAKRRGLWSGRVKMAA